MKKTVISAGAFLLGLMSLASCGKASGTSIVVWAPAEEEAVLTTIVDNYNKTAAADDKINVTFKAVSEADGGSTLATDPTVKGYPSLVAIADDQLSNLVQKNYITKLPASFAKTISEKNAATAVTAAKYGNDTYGFPITADNGYFLWYNGDALTAEQAGSLESILSVAEAGKKTFLMDVGNGWYVPSFFFAEGVCGTESLKWKMSANNKPIYDITWDGAEGVAAAKYINGLLQPRYLNKTLVVGSNDKIKEGFTSGEMIAAVSGTWMEADLKPVCNNLKAVKLPTFTITGTKHQMGSFTGTKLYVVNKYASVAEQKAAIILGDLLTNKESQLVRFEKRQALPCNLEAQKDSRYTANVTLGGKALTEQAQYAAIQSTSAEGRWWDRGAEIGNALLDGKLPETANTWELFLKAECDLLRAEAK